MANVAVVGAQWGDEGKGKIVDWLSQRADVVVRFQGGHNAGHTLVIGDVEYKLSLLPSGVVRPGKLSIIGNGVVVDPWALVDEIEAIRKKGVAVTPENLKLADNAALILPSHGALDRAREGRSGASRIGTTGRGIGPAYEDKVGRRAIRVCDLADPEALEARLDHCCCTTTRCCAGSTRPRSTAATSSPNCAPSHRKSCPTPARCGGCSTTRGATAAASCSRARRGRCSMSTTAPIRLSPRRTRSRARRRRGPASRPVRSAMSSASPRPTRRASAADRSRPS